MSQTPRPSLTVLTPDQVERIHDATLDVLWRTGIEINHQEAIKMLCDAGAQLDAARGRVLVPPELVERCIDQAPEKVILQARNSKHDLLLEPGGELYFRSMGGPDHYVDMEGEYREITSRDVQEWTTIIDALDNINYCMAIYPNDVPLETRDLHAVGKMLQYTEKHLMVQPYRARHIEHMLEISRLVAEGLGTPERGPLFSVFVSATSPLCYASEEVDILFTAGRHSVPVMLNSSALAGGNGPVTVAGATVLLNAETLAWFVLAQMANPGSPNLYSPRPLTLDMQSMIAAGGYIENVMTTVSAAQMAVTKYGVPVDLFGPMTDATLVGPQSIMEATYTSLLPALTGANIVAGFGMLDSLGSVSPIQLVILNELMSVIKRFLRGYEINEDTLAIGAIDELSRRETSERHDFLAADHTLKFFRSEYLMPELCSRKGRQSSMACEQESMIIRARARVRDILENHRVPELPREVTDEINAIMS